MALKELTAHFAILDSQNSPIDKFLEAQNCLVAEFRGSEFMKFVGQLRYDFFSWTKNDNLIDKVHFELLHVLL